MQGEEPDWDPGSDVEPWSYQGEDFRVPGRNTKLLSPLSTEVLIQVCVKIFSRACQVHQCNRGHFVCGDCRPRVQVGPVEYKSLSIKMNYCQLCPTCRGEMIGRAHGFEAFLQKLDI